MSIKKLAGETAIYGLSSILGRVLSFALLTPFLSRIMPDAEYGVINELFFYMAFGIALLVFRMDTVMFRFFIGKGYHPRMVLNRCRNWNQLAVIAFLALVLLFADQLADALQYPDRSVYVLLVALIIGFDALAAVPLAVLRLLNLAYVFAVINLLNIVLTIGLVFFLLYLAPHGSLDWFVIHDKVKAYLLAFAIASGLRFVILEGYLHWMILGHNASQRLPEDILDDFNYLDIADDPQSEKEWREGPSFKVLFSYAAPLTLVALAGIVNTTVAPAMIKMYHGGTVTQNLDWAGYYAAATKMAVFISLFVQAYNYAAEPFFFRQAGGDLSKANRHLFADSARGFMLVGSLAAAAILLLMPLLEVFVGEDKRVGFYVIPQLLAANVLLGLYYNFAMAYKLTDRTHLGALIAVLGSAVVLLGNALLVPRIGIAGSAWSALACFALMCALAYGVSRRYFPVPYRIDRMLVYALLASAAVYAGMQFEALWIRILCLVGLTLVFALLEGRWIMRVWRGESGSRGTPM